MIRRIYSDPAFESELVKIEIQARQRKSRLVTKLRRECECGFCSAGPRSPAGMLVTNPVKLVKTSETWLNRLSLTQ